MLNQARKVQNEQVGPWPRQSKKQIQKLPVGYTRTVRIELGQTKYRAYW